MPNRAINAVMPRICTDHLRAERSKVFICDRLIFVDFLRRTGKTFAMSTVQRLLKSKVKHIVPGASSAVVA